MTLWLSKVCCLCLRYGETLLLCKLALGHCSNCNKVCGVRRSASICMHEVVKHFDERFRLLRNSLYGLSISVFLISSNHSRNSLAVVTLVHSFIILVVLTFGKLEASAL